jgi:hypothetical protein
MQEKTSRLAGAGGAAEGALMNDHANPGQPEAGGGAEGKASVHVTKFTGKSRRAKTKQLFATTQVS